MEIKDWALLCIPIICNGIILFLFQQVYMRKIEAVEKKNTYKQEVLKELLSYLQDYYIKLRNIRLIDSSRSGKEYDFSTLWNPAAESMEKIKVYLDTHPKTIGESNIGIDVLINKWNSIIDMLYKSSVQNNHIISREVGNRFSKDYEEINTIVQKCLYSCEERIIG